MCAQHWGEKSVNFAAKVAFAAFLIGTFDRSACAVLKVLDCLKSAPFNRSSKHSRNRQHGPSRPHHSDSNARDRLEKELQDEGQHIRQARLQLTHIDPETKPSCCESLVCAMADALDRQVARGNAASSSPMAAQQADLFDGIGVEPGTLTAPIAQLRSLSAGDGESSNRLQVLNDCVSRNPARDPEDALARPNKTPIN